MESIARILLLLLLVTLLLNLAAGGPQRVGHWLHAKFVGS